MAGLIRCRTVKFNLNALVHTLYTAFLNHLMESLCLYPENQILLKGHSMKGQVKFSEQNGEGAHSFRYAHFLLISNKVIEMASSFTCYIF